MPKRQPFSSSALKTVAAALNGRWTIVAIVCAVLVMGAFGVAKYQRHRAAVAAELADEEEEERWIASLGRRDDSQHKPDASPAPDAQPAKPREGYATWYDVPDASLAKRRASEDGPEESKPGGVASSAFRATQVGHSRASSAFRDRLFRRR